VSLEKFGSPMFDQDSQTSNLVSAG
jgi:hypothetical protein